MEVSFSYELGIRPLEQTKAIEVSDYATVNVICRTINDLYPVWVKVSSALVDNKISLYKWRTLGYPITGSKLQEIKTLKSIRNAVSSCAVIKKNEDSEVISYVDFYDPDGSVNDLEPLTQHRYSALILTGKEHHNEYVNDALSFCEKGVDSQSIFETLQRNADFVFCRFIEDEQQACFQLIGETKNIDNIIFQLNEDDVGVLFQGMFDRH